MGARDYTLCLSGGEAVEGRKRQWVKQGDCTLLVVGFNDTQCRAIKRNTGHWQTRVNIVNSWGLSKYDRIAISQTFHNRTSTPSRSISTTNPSSRTHGAGVLSDRQTLDLHVV